MHVDAKPRANEMIVRKRSHIWVAWVIAPVILAITLAILSPQFKASLKEQLGVGIIGVIFALLGSIFMVFWELYAIRKLKGFTKRFRQIEIPIQKKQEVLAYLTRNGFTDDKDPFDPTRPVLSKDVTTEHKMASSKYMLYVELEENGPKLTVQMAEFADHQKMKHIVWLNCDTSPVSGLYLLKMMEDLNLKPL